METEPVVIRSQRERRPAEAANRDFRLSAFGITSPTTTQYRDDPEEVPGKENESHNTRADLAHVDKKHHLDLLSTTALILNKIIGTGIYASPKIVLAATGSKGMAMMVWIVGCVMAWAGLYTYLEYGMQWPVTGGELYYVDNVFRKPRRFVTYIFASMFVLINGVQGNALTFGKEIIVASSSQNTPVNGNLQKLFAVIIITLVCQLQAYSRAIYIRISNTLAVLKLLSLLFISVCGLVALANARVPAGSHEIHTPYGKEDLANAFATISSNPYQYALALLSVMRAFLGYENANFVLAEVRAGPKGDERRVFRRAVMTSVMTTCFLYIMVNLAFFAACTYEEIVTTPDTLPLFLQKVFGTSKQAPIGASVIIAFSAGGSVIALTFANVRVKQEIARMGLVAIPEFWSQTSRRGTPAHALFLHWIFSVICIVITPLSNPAGFLIMSTLYAYVHTYISILLGLGLLFAPWLPSFRVDEMCWKPRSSRFGWWLLAPLVVIYIASNAFVLILSWFPGNLQSVTHSTEQTLPYYTGPVAGVALVGFGILWWAWDEYITKWLGYDWRTEEEEVTNDVGVRVLRVHFHRTLRANPARSVVNLFTPPILWLWKFVSREPTV